MKSMQRQSAVMKRLFKVVKEGESVFFRAKEGAKEFRDQIKGAVVMRGPDHGLGESFNTSPKMRGKRSTF
jgi:hypothetical protein